MYRFDLHIYIYAFRTSYGHRYLLPKRRPPPPLYFFFTSSNSKLNRFYFKNNKKLADLADYRHRPGENDVIAHPLVARPARPGSEIDDLITDERLRSFEIDFIRATCKIPEKAKAVVLARLKEERLRQRQENVANIPDSNHRALIVGGPVDAMNNIKAKTLAYVNKFAGELSNSKALSHLQVPSSMMRPVAAPAMLVP